MPWGRGCGSTVGGALQGRSSAPLPKSTTSERDGREPFIAGTSLTGPAPYGGAG